MTELLANRRPLRHWGPLALGAFIFVICCVLGWRNVGTALDEALEIEVEDVRLTGLPLGALALEAELTVVNRRRLAAEYLGIEGPLTIAGRSIPYSIEGLSAGDVVASGERRRVVLRVRPEAADLLSIGVSAALARKLEVRFDGTVRVEVLRLRVSLPLSIRRSFPTPMGRSRGD